MCSLWGREGEREREFVFQNVNLCICVLYEFVENTMIHVHCIFGTCVLQVVEEGVAVVQVRMIIITITSLNGIF